MTLTPTTASGRWSIWFLGGSLLALAVFFLSAGFGVKGGQTWLGQPLEAWVFLAIPLFVAAGLSIAGGVAAIVAYIRDRDHGLASLLPIAWALIVVLFLAGEFTSPH